MRFIPKQRSNCAKCGQAIVERRRKPCPTCGSFNRMLVRTLTDTMPIKDKA